MRWRKPTEAEVAAGEKRKKISQKIWCEGEVMNVANGTTQHPPHRLMCRLQHDSY